MALIAVDDLTNLMMQHLHAAKLPEVEYLAVRDAVGRVLANDVVSPMNVPHANVSAMDGYAVAQAVDAGVVLTLVGESAAGRPFSGSVEQGECVRIMTGAVVPDDCVAVVMQENTEIQDDGSILIKQAIQVNDNIRYAGEEIMQGQTVLSGGRVLRDADILLLAALGVGKVAVYRRIKVAVFSTGDELCEPEQPLSGSQYIYDSNRHALMARLSALPVEIIDFHIIRDDLAAIEQALIEAANVADVVITSGGVSVGDYDYLCEVVARIGKIHHYKVAMKPGKPFVFGQLGQAWYFGLAGNPISGFVGFDVLVKSALWRLCGVAEELKPLRLQAKLLAPVKKAVGRMDIQRAVITRQADGLWTVVPCGAQDSHRILGMSQANAYLLLPESCGHLAVGEMVEVQPFAQAFL